MMKVDDALRRVLKGMKVLAKEIVALADSQGRVLAEETRGLVQKIIVLEAQQQAEAVPPAVRRLIEALQIQPQGKYEDTWTTVTRRAYDALPALQSLLAERERVEIESEKLREATQRRLSHLEAALRAIQRREGPYSQDPLRHAENVMLNMAELARRGIAGEPLDD